MSGDRLSILIADDEMNLRVIIKAYLSEYDVDLVEARNGKEALDYVRKNPVDLMILDNGMPLMTGQEVLENMLKDPALEKIPVIVYTAGGMERHVENMLKTSATAFLEKSNLGDDLVPTIKKLLGPCLKKIED
jgi:CheY-like chemotaxis protein